MGRQKGLEWEHVVIQVKNPKVWYLSFFEGVYPSRMIESFSNTNARMIRMVHTMVQSIGLSLAKSRSNRFTKLKPKLNQTKPPNHLKMISKLNRQYWIVVVITMDCHSFNKLFVIEWSVKMSKSQCIQFVHSFNMRVTIVRSLMHG